MVRLEDMTEDDFRKPLTNEQWQAVKRLLASRKPPVGEGDDGRSAEPL